MARRARDATPAPQREVYAGVHAGPPVPTQPARYYTDTTPPQSALPERTSPPERPLRRRLRDHTHRNRAQVKPWLWLFLPAPALLVHGLLATPWLHRARPWVLLALLAVGVLMGVIQWFRQPRTAFRIYALACTAAATAWTSWTVTYAVWGRPGKYSPLAGLCLWLPLAYLWWDRHSTRIQDQAEPKREADPFLTAWAAKVEPVLGWTAGHGEDIAAGRRYRVRLKPGQTIEDAEENRRKIASYLGMSRKRLTFEPLTGDGPGDDGDESLITLIVTAAQNPQRQEQTWRGPTLDRATGLYRHGVYPDAAAFMRLFKTEDGIPHRAVNGLWTGATGSGKSRGLAIKIAEHIHSGMFAVWYADGKEGASAPELEDRVDWYATSVDETIRMLRAAWKVMKVRKRITKNLNQAAFRGEDVMRLGDPGLPFLQVVLDEAQEFLRHKIAARLVKALLRMGNEVGIGLDLATQVPLLNELGAEAGDGGAEVIRGMAKSGNLAVYRAEDSFTGTVTVSNDLNVNPMSLPNIPGFCFVFGHERRPVPVRTYHASKTALFGWLVEVDVVTLDEASARAAGEDYATRAERALEADVAPEEIDLDDLDVELAILLGEPLPSQESAGDDATSLTVKEAVFQALKAHGGPMKREEVIAAVAAMGKEASDSAVAQALKWWCDAGHVTPTGQHGFYDLANRESITGPVGAGV
ncbi:hypothetical protein GCM10023196_036480 [Actinoallomurus vinaceus]|uniref:FtsK domain-containing protein n=1 Tax=Actinoallomurus vinaceus TaxID=1080074 RepID=A0ABP8UCE0_9ACTN